MALLDNFLAKIDNSENVFLSFFYLRNLIVFHHVGGWPKTFVNGSIKTFFYFSKRYNIFAASSQTSRLIDWMRLGANLVKMYIYIILKCIYILGVICQLSHVMFKRYLKKWTDTQTHTRTNRLIESIGPEGRCFENFYSDINGQHGISVATVWVSRPIPGNIQNCIFKSDNNVLCLPHVCLTQSCDLPFVQCRARQQSWVYVIICSRLHLLLVTSIIWSHQ